jgi:sialate O-acetylesterase
MRTGRVSLILTAMVAVCVSTSPASDSGDSAPQLMIDKLTLPSLFTDNMVLQRGVDVPVWGSAAPGERITITLGTLRTVAVADTQGRWTAHLGPLEAGGPFELAVIGRQTIVLSNVLIGEVWVCSGQSNMSFSLSQSRGAPEDVDEADFPRLRLFTVNRDVADRPQTRHGGRWEVTTPETAGKFSAVAYYFGREIHESLGVPVGLIHTSWAGSPIESWMSKEALESDPSFKSIFETWAQKVAANQPQIDRYEKEWLAWRRWADGAIAAGAQFDQQPDGPEGPRHQDYPSNLYNAMVAPLAPYAIKGVIWYQGEGNRERAAQYRKLFPTMIRDWRRLFGQGDIPFLFVQLANYGKKPWNPAESRTAELREAQLMALSLPKTGMAVTIDVGDPSDVHPTNKKDVGHRLSLLARAIAYGQDLVSSGPLYDSMKVEGNRIRVFFKPTGGGLEAGGRGVLHGFSIAGADHKFVWADAKIEGETVLVSQKEVKEPVAVRYAWGDSPSCTLFNKLGLPASPFRTDSP